ncbi:family 20 glycosylhydrolase [Lentisphaerota bacterium WC36G]|nr:beta-N-acetylhexosaminidase [Lentisphaerae bacterium WC36]
MDTQNESIFFYILSSEISKQLLSLIKEYKNNNELASLNIVDAIPITSDCSSKFCKKIVVNNVEQVGNEKISFSYKFNNSQEIEVKANCIVGVFRALADILAKDNEIQDVTEEIFTSYKKFGTMVDCSRNAVLHVDYMKKLVRRCALLGFNRIYMYCEETYKLKNEPYFGYLRGAYSAEEIREIDNYAAQFGIEIVPSIQVLGHLEKMLQWDYYKDIKDGERTILVGETKSYKLIEKMVDFWRKNIRSNDICIGFDETYGLGRGQFMDKNGFVPPFEIFSQHLKKVHEICSKYKFNISIWSDMFFRMGSETKDYYDLGAQIPENAVAAIPVGITLTYWDYFHTDENFYDDYLTKHFKLVGEDKSKVAMAVGTWNWRRLFYDQALTEKTVKPCLQSCRKNDVEEVFFTMWADDGAYCSLESTLLGLVFASEYGYRNEDDVNDEHINNLFKIVSNGGNYHNMRQCCAINIEEIIGFCLLHDDPMYALYFNECLAQKRLTIEQLRFATNFVLESVAKSTDTELCDLKKYLELSATFLQKKFDFITNMYQKYKNNDKESLNALIDEIDEIKVLLEQFIAEFRKVWLANNKFFGFETVQLRLGGQLARWSEVKQTLSEYCNDEIANIEILDEVFENPKGAGVSHVISQMLTTNIF